MEPGSVPRQVFRGQHIPTTSGTFAMTTEQNNRSRHQIRPGLQVRIVQKGDQGSGRLTEGTVREILTNSAFHPHGIKVRLNDGRVGRVREICTPDPDHHGGARQGPAGND